MARKPAPPKGVEWENTLPSRYESVLNGFLAEMTVAQLANHVELDAAIPEKIKAIKIGSFTPNMLNHDKPDPDRPDDPTWASFWRQPVRNMPQTTRNALEDPDIAAILAEHDFYIDTKNPTMENLVWVAQLQLLGRKLREAELASDTFEARLLSLRDPKVYKTILDSDVNRQLGSVLPAKMPEIKIGSGENRVKRLGSAWQKGTERAGRPKDVEAFLADPDNYGVFRVSDVMRTKLYVAGGGKDIDQDFDRKYKDVTNVLAVAFKLGVLGMIAEEVSDQISYPPSQQAKDQVPVAMMKCQMVHGGPEIVNRATNTAEKSFIYLPVEMQIAALPKFADDYTHGLYAQSRQIKGERDRLVDAGSTDVELITQLTETIALFDNQRDETFNRYLPTATRQRRQRFNDSRNGRNRDLQALADGKPITPETEAQLEAARRGQVVQPRDLAFEDEISRALYEKADILQPNGGTFLKALEVAKNEFAYEGYVANANALLIPLDPRRQDARKAFRMMIQQSGADITERTPPRKAPQPLDLAVVLN